MSKTTEFMGLKDWSQACQIILKIIFPFLKETSPTTLPINKEALAAEDDKRKRATLVSQKEDAERS